MSASYEWFYFGTDFIGDENSRCQIQYLQFQQLKPHGWRELAGTNWECFFYLPPFSDVNMQSCKYNIDPTKRVLFAKCAFSLPLKILILL